jgi:hypothetical protein
MAKEASNSIGYVILGIVAIMAIVGLVLLFTSASTTGKVAVRYGYPYAEDWYNRAMPQEGFEPIAPYRVGQAPQPQAWADRVNTAAGQGAEAQYIATY